MRKTLLKIVDGKDGGGDYAQEIQKVTYCLR